VFTPYNFIIPFIIPIPSDKNNSQASIYYTEKKGHLILNTCHYANFLDGAERSDYL